MSLLRTESLSLAFDRPLFDALDLEVEGGDIVYLSGGNGAGKSSFLRCLSGHQSPDQGRILLQAGSLHELPPWQIERSMPTADQDPCLEQGVPAIDHLVDSLSLGSGWKWLFTRREAARRQALALLSAEIDQLGLAGAIERPTYALSYGQQKLLTLLRCLRPLPDGAPRILLLDEPLAGIRPARYKPILELLRERLERGWAILVIEHLDAIHQLGPGREIRFPALGAAA